MSRVESYQSTIALVTFLWHNNPSYLLDSLKPYPQFKQGVRQLPIRPLEGCHTLTRALLESPLELRHKLYIRALERGYKA